MTRNIPLQKGIIYGPVNSRRLGRSLGINLSPVDHKVCSFNCVYCHYGWTNALSHDLSAYRHELPEPRAVEAELRAVLERLDPPPQYITFSGNGEPSLHPAFPEIVDLVLGVRDSLGLEARVAILSNSTGVGDEGVRQALGKLDVRIMKLDAGNDEVFERINRPAKGVDLEGIVEGLRLLDDVTLQSVFVEGGVANTDPADIEAWLEKVVMIRPVTVQIYSLENAPAMTDLVGVDQEKLEAIAARVRKFGIDAQVF